MMQAQAMQELATSPIKKLPLPGSGDARLAERAFESFAVMLWQMAQMQDNVGSWMRACEHLYALRLFFDRMRLPHLADWASDLIAVAGYHAEAMIEVKRTRVT